MPQTILQTILETKRNEVELLRKAHSLEELKAAAAAAAPARNFFAAVSRPGRRKVNLIAEVKKASPSAGVIRADFDPVAAARAYAEAGVDAISVLTDEKYFQGHLDYLRAIRAAVDLPLLRKDFIIDPLQVYQSRAAGADAILLIAAALPAGMVLDLTILASQLRMTVLLEVHTADELEEMRFLLDFPHRSYMLLGINNRDLSTFQVDLDTSVRLAGLAGPGVPIVSESGIRTSKDIDRLVRSGVRAVLVGQTLMSQPDLKQAVRDLVGE